MIDINLLKRKGIYQGLTTKGHALFDDYGKDIVCAAASVLVINTINSIETLTSDKINVDVVPGDGIINMEFISSPTHESRLLMDSLLLGLQSIRKKYGDNYLRVNIKEV
jgi:hypothetical protein